MRLSLTASDLTDASFCGLTSEGGGAIRVFGNLVCKERERRKERPSEL